MPFLDAKALETDPDGMAFLRSVIAEPQQKPTGLTPEGDEELALRFEGRFDRNASPQAPRVAAEAQAPALTA
jgi:hypothetical protein